MFTILHLKNDLYISSLKSYTLKKKTELYISMFTILHLQVTNTKMTGKKSISHARLGLWRISKTEFNVWVET